MVSDSALEVIKHFYLQITRLAIYHRLTLFKESYLLQVAAKLSAMHSQVCMATRPCSF